LGNEIVNKKNDKTNTMEVNMLSRVADGMFWLNRYMEELMACCLLNTLYIMSFDQETNDYKGINHY
jgi:hypothetical protein